MRKQKKSDKNDTLQKLVLATALLNLIKSVIDIITKILN